MSKLICLMKVGSSLRPPVLYSSPTTATIDKCNHQLAAVVLSFLGSLPYADEPDDFHWDCHLLKF